MSARPLRHSIHNVGVINKNKRIWIANQSILKSFGIGDPVFIEYSARKKEIVITKVEILSNHSISSRNGKTPILDIKNSTLTKTFDEIEKVEVLYFKNKIVIRATKNEKAKKVSKNKTDLTLFEIFCGGGSMTHILRLMGTGV